jgi:hypothetical protein
VASVSDDWRRLPWVAPASSPEDADQIQNFLGVEREQLIRFVEWSKGLKRIAIGSTFSESIPLLLKPCRIPLSVLRDLGGPTPVVGYPISGRPIETPTLLFPHGESPPLDRPIILRSVRRQVVSLVRRGELESDFLLTADSWAPASFREYLPPLPGPHEVEDVVPAVLDEFPRSRSVVEAALLGFAGSPAVAGEGAGLDVTFGSPAVDSQTSRNAAESLVALLPPWESTPLARKSSRAWAGNPKRFPTYSPYGILLDSFSSGRRHMGHPVGTDRSTVLAGLGVGRDLVGMLLGGDHPVLRSGYEVSELAASRPRVEAIVPALSLFTYAHALEVVTPPEEEISRAKDGAINDIANSARTLLQEAGVSAREVDRYVRISEPLRLSVHRAALAHARLSLRTEAMPGDFDAVGRSFADSVAAVMSHGRPSDLRPYLVDVSVAISANERNRLATIESILLSRPGSSPEEIWDVVQNRGLWSDLRELEGYLDVQYEKGQIIVKADRRLEWVQ